MCAMKGVRDKEIFPQKSLSQHPSLATTLVYPPPQKNEKKKICKDTEAFVGCCWLLGTKSSAVPRM